MMAKMICRSIILLLCLAGVGAQAAANTETNNNKLSVGSDNFCQGCKSIVSFTQTLNASNERDESRNLLASFCHQYYPPSTDYQGPCTIFVEGFFMFMDRIDPIHHCDAIGACGSTTTTTTSVEKISSIQPTRSENVICQFCEQIIQQAQTVLTDPKIIDQIKLQLDAFCDYLQVIGQDKECHQLERKYLKQAIEFLKNIDPKQYCTSIQLCKATPSGLGQSNVEVTKKMPSLIDFTDFGIETSVHIGDKSITIEQASKSQNELISSATNYQQGPNCIICKALVKEMFQFVRENKTEENIMIGLDRVCNLLYRHEPSLSQCKSMVKAYTKEIIQLLIDETDPEMICIMLEQCTHEPKPKPTNQAQTATSTDQMNNNNTGSQRKAFGLSELISALDSSVELKSTRSCVECKLFINYLKESLEDPKSQEYMKKWLLEHLCADLTHNLTGSCIEMVNEYSAVFFKAVDGSINPETACVELDVCSQQKLRQVLVIDNDPTPISPPSPYRPRIIRPQSKNNGLLSAAKASNSIQIGSQFCDQCVSIITEIDAYLSSHSIDGDVSVLIDKVCNNMPEGAVRNECTFVVKAFGSSLIQMIAQMKNPREVCSKIDIC